VPQATAVGVDISADALATADRNARENGVAERFETLRSDWFAQISGRFDAIVSNPPYIRTEEIETLQREVFDHDPEKALDGGGDGLDAYRIISTQAGKYLTDGGHVAVEIGHEQRHEVALVFESAGWRVTEARKDFGGRDRVLVFERG
jgi:release factor glutamine methyltransferase